MNQIIDNIFLESVNDANSFYNIIKYRLEQIINVVIECTNKKHQLVQYDKFNIYDDNDFDEQKLNYVYNTIQYNVNQHLFIVHMKDQKVLHLYCII